MWNDAERSTPRVKSAQFLVMSMRESGCNRLASHLLFDVDQSHCLHTSEKDFR